MFNCYKPLQKMVAFPRHKHKYLKRKEHNHDGRGGRAPGCLFFFLMETITDIFREQWPDLTKSDAQDATQKLSMVYPHTPPPSSPHCVMLAWTLFGINLNTQKCHYYCTVNSKFCCCNTRLGVEHFCVYYFNTSKCGCIDTFPVLKLTP